MLQKKDQPYSPLKTIRPWLMFLLLPLIALDSCQKVVNIDLNEASPHIVIEGVITDSLGPYTVKLTLSGSYYNQPVINAVTGAQVMISDLSFGSTDTLTESFPGVYLTSKTRGIPGHTYQLMVISGGKSYSAESTMHAHVPIDSLTIETTDRFNRRFSDHTKGISCHFMDPANEKNYYRVKLFVNDSTQADRYRLYDDQYYNGEETDIRAGNASPGDSVRVELMSIDKSTYDFYRTLSDILRINPFFGSTPANPNTNLSNGALGYFAAMAIDTKTMVVPLNP